MIQSPENLSPTESILIIVSQNPDNSNHGTGFIIYNDDTYTFVLTCAHVIRDVDEKPKIRRFDAPAEVIARGSDNAPNDLAVLRTQKIELELPTPTRLPALPLKEPTKTGIGIIIPGYYLFDRTTREYMIRPLTGILSGEVGRELGRERFNAWDLQIDAKYPLQRGYSGSPVIDKKEGTVLGIVSHRLGEEGTKGLAIALDTILKVWSDAPTGFLTRIPGGTQKTKAHARPRKTSPPGKTQGKTDTLPIVVVAKEKTTSEATPTIQPRIRQVKSKSAQVNIARQPPRFFVFDVRSDTIDFHDKFFQPGLISVPPRIELESYREYRVPVLNQGDEGGSIGFALATVANYLLRHQHNSPDPSPVSARMFYEMAKRHDAYSGEAYSAASARSALIGWYRHGVCSEKLWPYKAGVVDRILTHRRAEDAVQRPLAAYYRVNHKDLSAMQSALAEVGILFATACVHDGWDDIGKFGWILYHDEMHIRGGHAFAIMGYNENGFWIQNSWGEGWGLNGFGLLTYDDWLNNGMDAWVAQIGVPMQRTFKTTQLVASSYSHIDLRPHIVQIDWDGMLSERGTYATPKGDLKNIIINDFPRITQDWETKNLLIYVNGGLTSENSFVQRMAEYRKPFLSTQVYPLGINWYSGLWEKIGQLLENALRQMKPKERLDNWFDFMLDRLNDSLEPTLRNIGGQTLWREVKEISRQTMLNGRGGQLLAIYLAELLSKMPTVKIHLLAHSAGSIFLAGLADLLASKGKISHWLNSGSKGLGLDIASCTLWAPAIAMVDFHETYLSHIQSGSIQRFSLYTLTDYAEQADNVANIYRRSLLFLVSNALEEHYDTPLLGMERFVYTDLDLRTLVRKGNARWIHAPKDTDPSSSRATRHGDFDHDPPTLMSTLADILPAKKMPEENIFHFRRTADTLQSMRKSLEK